ncbi:MAG: intermembrane transport protein PqiB [Paraglaciecola sp.]|uniref:intermembrane transport protein PqiB n=1 Tax=Paraglaciecola sp. TaxID=1920173 RepID=UPI00273FCCC9|nr:intermembrane transport protein PqiB [Paraglaciecola sp.]MDP5032000.1 intermembrane transport protein PqiB [Paraglaciecola sp.]MDP5130030.1 intermembrane transport protein PqiB [Paraglaciecola sp.]
MSDHSNLENDTSTREVAEVKPVRRVSKIWFIPLVALFIGMWMVYYQWSSQGPLIVISFPNATGIEAGKTKIKTRSVDIGVVKKIELADDLQGVLVTARMNANVASLLHKDSQFWIVSPRISLNGISGLGTIMSGPYINMAPGEEQEKSTHFSALSAPPVTPAGTPGLHITLNSNAEFAYKEGDPVIYKGLKVGEIEDTYFNFEERVVYYNTFINAPYHKLITENTKFWDTSGISVQLNAGGVKFDTGSLESLLTNGVTFGVPEGIPSGDIISKRTNFDIHSNYDEASEQRYKLSVEFVILVKDTVRGLHVGAPVEYRGLEIGKVLAINPPELNKAYLLEESFDIPVIIGIQPGRVQQSDDQRGLDYVKKQTLVWVSEGLRASLKMGNFLTGALFVDLQHYPDEKPSKISTLLNYDVIPTVSNEFAQITAKISAVLDNINQIKLQNIADNTNTMLLNMTQTAESLKKTSENFDHLVSSFQGEKLNSQLAETLNSLSQLTKDFSAGSENYQEVNQTLRTIQNTLNDMQPLLLQLNNKPNSLIFGDGIEEQRLEPKAAKRDQAPSPTGNN